MSEAADEYGAMVFKLWGYGLRSSSLEGRCNEVFLFGGQPKASQRLASAQASQSPWKYSQDPPRKTISDTTLKSMQGALRFKCFCLPDRFGCYWFSSFGEASVRVLGQRSFLKTPFPHVRCGSALDSRISVQRGSKICAVSSVAAMMSR